MDPVTSSPDYTYKGLGKFYIAIHLAEQAAVIRGTVGGKLKTDFSRAVPFSELRSVRTYQDKGFFVSAQGIEIEIADLDTPVVRIPMNPREQKVWISRLGQVCKMTPVI